jgi:beta-lactamase class C
MKSKTIIPILLIGLILSIVLKISLYPGNPGIHYDVDTLLVKFDAYVKNFIHECGAPGSAIAIVKEGKIEYVKTFGVREMGKPEKIDEHTVFRIASLSKGFASVLTGLLVDKGYISWDDRVIKYVKNFSLKDSTSTQNLTIRNILSHTSGIVHHAYDNLLEAKIPFEKIIPRLKEVEIFAPVGECYSYQNTIFSLISPIIESATKQSFQKLLLDTIFIPLGMNDASCDLENLLADSNFAVPHIKRKNSWLPVQIKDKYYSVTPAAGINASINDMALWLFALVAGRPDVIPLKIIEEVSKPVIHTPYTRGRYNWHNRIKSAYYGMGWRIFDYNGNQLVYHSGGVKGYLAKIGFLPKYRTGIVLLMNSTFRNDFIYQFIEMYLRAKQKQVS